MLIRSRRRAKYMPHTGATLPPPWLMSLGILVGRLEPRQLVLPVVARFGNRATVAEVERCRRRSPAEPRWCGSQPSEPIESDRHNPTL